MAQVLPEILHQVAVPEKRKSSGCEGCEGSCENLADDLLFSPLLSRRYFPLFSTDPWQQRELIQSVG
jgi:hypothetical protein